MPMHLERLYMKPHMGVLAEAASQPLLDAGGTLVRLEERNVARHPDMHLDGDVASYAAGAEMVDLAGYRFLVHYIYDFLFHVLRKAFLKQLVG